MEEISKLEIVAKACNQLLQEAPCEFAGLAIQNDHGPDVRWHYAAGNRNEKYKRITVRYGKGIAGRVISTGRPMMVEDFPNNIIGKILEYPIMLAENLVSAYAVPISINRVQKGVLLIGRRIPYHFSEDEKEIVNQTAAELEHMLRGE